MGCREGIGQGHGSMKNFRKVLKIDETFLMTSPSSRVG